METPSPGAILIAGKMALTWALPLSFAFREIWKMRRLRQERSERPHDP